MIKNLIKGFMLCSCLTGLTVDAMESALIRTSSSPEMSSRELVVCGIRPRGDSAPVTKGEKARAIKRIGVKGFLNMAKEEAASYESVTFENVEINEEFVDKFWETFPRGVDELSFNGCKTAEGYSFADLFDGDYKVCELSIINSDITLDDVDNVFFRMYPYTIKRFDFSGNQLDKTAVSQRLYYRLGSFANSVGCSL